VTPWYWLSLPLLVVIGGASTAAMALSNTLLLQIVDDQMRGRVMGFFMASAWGGWRVGALPIGLMAEAWSTPFAIGLAAGTLLLAQVPVARSRVVRGRAVAEAA
jgi:hypothetical protein